MACREGQHCVMEGLHMVLRAKGPSTPVDGLHLLTLATDYTARLEGCVVPLVHRSCEVHNVCLRFSSTAHSWQYLLLLLQLRREPLTIRDVPFQC
jgi:hypothetical protein